MRERPILFSTPMVQAILENRKTVTRRIKKDQPCIDPLTGDWLMKGFSGSAEEVAPWEDYINLFKDGWTCPFGKPGDVLWVREEHFRFGRWIKNGTTKTGRQKWKFEALDREVRYTDTMKVGYLKSRSKGNPSSPYWYKRLARFMPKVATRTWLEIVSARVERLQSITQNSAIAEGIEVKHDDDCDIYKDYEATTEVSEFGDTYYETPFFSFKSLWKKIHGEQSWNDNPFVWVVEFKRIEKP